MEKLENKLSYKNKVVVFEKEKIQGFHQSGRNSGVLHCGLSYTPGTLKAELSVKGIREMIDFAIKNKIDCSQLLLKLLAFDAICRSKVTNKSYSIRTQDPVCYGISKIIPFMTQTKQRNEHETKKQKVLQNQTY